MDKTAKELALSLVESGTNALVGSVDGDGFPNIKAMLPPREHDGLAEFWFTTNTSSARVAQFRKNQQAALYFFDARNFVGVLLRGTMEVLTDAVAKERIWREGDTMYYPKGVTDPDYCVLRFTARDGRLYRNFSSENFTV